MTKVDIRVNTRQNLIRTWFSRRPLAGDALLTLLVTAATTGIVLLNAGSGITPRPVGVSWFFMLLGSLPILVRRVRLWWSVAGIIAVVAAGVADPVLGMSSALPSIVIVYSIAAYAPWRSALALAGLLWAAVTATTFVPTDLDFTGTDIAVGLLYSYVTMSIAFGIGRTVYNRRQNLVELRERARLAEENQVALAAQAVADERRRIARELHDVVAHHISVMGVMATGARRMLTKDPDKADEALATIETTGRSTLREMRRLLDVLRATEEAGPSEELTPQPGLDAVHALVSQVREAGLTVNLTIEGDPYPIDPGIALTVYRIVQESLTNTLKHAGPSRAQVRIQYLASGFDLEVTDTGAGPRHQAPDRSRVGHGLVGMRERVALYGGNLRTGPRPGGGFRVHAVIPIDPPAATPTIETGGTR